MFEIPALIGERWSDDACMGYAIKALENLDYKPEEIQEIINEIRYYLDAYTLGEANAHYSCSRY